ncbi:MAG: Fic family protein [Clostridia bacterium]|nr:Fic family protein [Clostridia bacterium]
MYEPPYSITNDMLRCVSEISEKIGRIDGSRLLETHPHLRHNNRIRSVHSSLKIEANSLSLEDVRGVLNGKTVVGPKKEILEVQNAFAAYKELGSLDPYSIDVLKRIHGIMTDKIVDESGMFRTGNEGVFNGDRCIFVAPPPDLVPKLMHDLFDWMKNSRNSLHPLILSSVFHYEFVFIHPFKDGNGRMARLWQTALLSQWNPVFRDIPIESRIEEFAQGYYDAIDACNHSGNCTVFVEFMLAKINESLDDVMKRLQSESKISGQVNRLLAVMDFDVPYTAKSLMELLHLSSRDGFRRNYLVPAIEQGLVRMEHPDKPSSRSQRYLRI